MRLGSWLSLGIVMPRGHNSISLQCAKIKPIIVISPCWANRPIMIACAQRTSQTMPETKERKRGGGPKPYRTFFTSIHFHISPKLHIDMKAVAAEHHVRLEDVYRDAVLMMLKLRQRKAIAYQAAPRLTHSTHITVKMHGDLIAQVRETTDADHHAMSDFFETAVNLYLGTQGCAWRKQHPPRKL